VVKKPSRYHSEPQVIQSHFVRGCTKRDGWRCGIFRTATLRGLPFTGLLHLEGDVRVDAVFDDLVVPDDRFEVLDPDGFDLIHVLPASETAGWAASSQLLSD
jgi:hypothetical protein